MRRRAKPAADGPGPEGAHGDRATARPGAGRGSRASKRSAPEAQKLSASTATQAGKQSASDAEQREMFELIESLSRHGERRRAREEHHAFFLSYRPCNGSTQARLLQARLDAHGGCWCDLEHAEREERGTQSAAAEAVRAIAGADCVVLVLTDGVLSRWQCRLELRAAQRLRKPVLLVHGGFAPTQEPARRTSSRRTRSATDDCLAAFAENAAGDLQALFEASVVPFGDGVADQRAAVQGLRDQLASHGQRVASDDEASLPATKLARRSGSSTADARAEAAAVGAELRNARAAVERMAAAKMAAEAAVAKMVSAMKTSGQPRPEARRECQLCFADSAVDTGIFCRGRPADMAAAVCTAHFFCAECIGNSARSECAVGGVWHPAPCKCCSQPLLCKTLDETRDVSTPDEAWACVPRYAAHPRNCREPALCRVAGRYEREIVASEVGGAASAPGMLPCPLFPHACDRASLSTFHLARALTADAHAAPDGVRKTERGPVSLGI